MMESMGFSLNRRPLHNWQMRSPAYWRILNYQYIKEKQDEKKLPNLFIANVVPKYYLTVLGFLSLRNRWLRQAPSKNNLAIFILDSKSLVSESLRPRVTRD